MYGSVFDGFIYLYAIHFCFAAIFEHSVHMMKMYKRDVDKILNICYNVNKVTDALIWSL